MPHCPANFSDYFKSFEPGYPFGQPYETLTGWAIQNGFDARTTAGATNILIKGFLSLAKIVPDAIQDGLPSSFIYSFKVIASRALSLAIIGFDVSLEFGALHDGLVESAEIEATYENTLQMLDGSAAIYDEVVCRCKEDYTLRGQGCDGRDNNCDQIIDDW